MIKGKKKREKKWNIPVAFSMACMHFHELTSQCDSRWTSLNKTDLSLALNFVLAVIADCYQQHHLNVRLSVTNIYFEASDWGSKFSKLFRFALQYTQECYVFYLVHFTDPSLIPISHCLYPSLYVYINCIPPVNIKTTIICAMPTCENV